jgi:hypothetical protein
MSAGFFLSSLGAGREDARGCLGLDDTVKVGFATIEIDIHLDVAKDTDPRRLQQLHTLAERLCVTADTLRSGVPIKISYPAPTEETQERGLPTGDLSGGQGSGAPTRSGHSRAGGHG